MKKNIIYTVLLSLMIFGNTGCKDYYQELNQDPANVTGIDPKGLMAQAVLKFQPYDYLIWFYNSDYTCRWIQMGMPAGKYKSFTADYTGMKESGGQGSQYLETLRLRNDIRRSIAVSKDENERAFEAVCTLLSVYLGIFDTDMFGAVPYVDACKYDEGIITPDYQMVDELYEIFLAQLDSCITVFQNENNLLKTTYSTQDVIYNGDLKKWSKLANSLKLKIAVRYYNNDPAKAKSIAEAVAKSEIGYVDSKDEDMLFCKTLKASNEDYVYGTGNDLSQIGLTRNVHNFLLGSLDPRLRFIYTKNGLNSTVIQAFLDSNKFNLLPDEVKDVVVLSADKKKFVKWGGLGEPWVRYQSFPVAMEPTQTSAAWDSVKNIYFSNKNYFLEVDGTKKEYTPFSYQTDELKKGRNTYTIPTLGKTVKEDKDNHPLYCMYMTAAEVNLYLAEFAALGASLPKSAKEYYDRGVKLSVETYDRLASLNQIPYYGKTYDYDTNEVVIDLKSGEIEKMMETANVKFEGTSEQLLEKIYLQQLIHFSLMTNDQFVTARRSGYPKIDSKLLPLVKFSDIELEAVPRRFEFKTPSVTDQMYTKMTEAYSKQGLTSGTGLSGHGYEKTTLLNTERLWQDKNGPQWGSGK